jgi:hypothetical protein
MCGAVAEGTPTVLVKTESGVEAPADSLNTLTPFRELPLVRLHIYSSAAETYAFSFEP